MDFFHCIPLEEAEQIISTVLAGSSLHQENVHLGLAAARGQRLAALGDAAQGALDWVYEVRHSGGCWRAGLPRGRRCQIPCR